MPNRLQASAPGPSPLSRLQSPARRVLLAGASGSALAALPTAPSPGAAAPGVGTAEKLMVKAQAGVSVLRYIPEQYWANVLTGNGMDYDCTQAINAAIADEREVWAPPGIYRCDGKIIVTPGRSMRAAKGAWFKRFSASSNNTDAILLLKGDLASWYGGALQTENASGNGIVQLGHENDSSQWNATRWRFTAADVLGVQAAGNVALYVPNSQTRYGTAYANYLGLVDGVTIQGCDVGVYLTEMSNAHEFRSITFFAVKTAAYRLRGAYGNRVMGGFLHSGTNGVIAVWLQDKVSNGDHNSIYNCFIGFGAEPGGKASRGVVIEAGSGGNYIRGIYNVAGGNSIGSTSNNVDTGFQTSLRGGAFHTVSVPRDGTFVGLGAHRVQQSSQYTLSGTVGGGATKTIATVTVQGVQRAAAVDVRLVAKGAVGQAGGSALAALSIYRLGAGAVVEELQRLNGVAGVKLAACVVQGNEVAIRATGPGDDRGTAYPYVVQLSVLSEDLNDFLVS